MALIIEKNGNADKADEADKLSPYSSTRYPISNVIEIGLCETRSLLLNELLACRVVRVVVTHLTMDP